MGEPTGMLAYIIAGREIRLSTTQAKCLLQYYCSNVGKDGTFYKSTLDICAETHLAESTVRRLNQGMKTAGILTWVEGDWRKKLANTYALSLPKLQALAAHSKNLCQDVKEKAREKAAARARRYREKHHPSRRVGA